MHHMMLSNLETQNSSQLPDSSTNKVNLFSESTEDADSSLKFSSLKNFNKQDLIIYFSNHITDMIDLAFNDTETDDGKKAFIFLSRGPQLIIDALTKDFTFFMKVTEVFQNSLDSSNKLNLCTIKRISVIFNYLILNDVQFSIDSIGFLTQLLPYIGEYAVFELFHTVFAAKARLKQMRNMLSDTDIDTFILNELGNCPKELDGSSFLSYSKKLNLLSIIYDGLMSKQLKKSFQNVKVLDALLSTAIEVKEPLLLNKIWASFALLVDQNLITNMKNVFKEAMRIICQPLDNIHSYHVSIFDFLANIVDINASMFTSNQKKQICQIFQNLILKFPNSTHLISSIFNFIRKSLHNRDFAQRILDGYLSLFIEQGKSEKRTAASANALIFLADLDEMKTSSYMISKSLSDNRKYVAFYKSFFKNYLEELHKPYGGNIQICYSRK